MKFTEYPYKRPDVAEICAEYDSMAKAVPGADAERLIEFIGRHEKLNSECETMGSLAYVRHTIDTRDEFYEKEQEFYDENGPVLGEKQKVFFDAVLASPHRAALEERFGKLLFLNKELESRTISAEAVPFLQQEAAVVTKYAKLMASAQIEFEGKTFTLPALSAEKQSPDRAYRRRVYEAEAAFFLSKGEELDSMYDQLVKIRTQLARTLGFKTYTELGYLRMTRNCYTPEMVATFRKSVESSITPICTKIKSEQARRLGLPKLTFIDDLCVFPEGNPRPVGTSDETIASGVRMYHEMSPETTEFIDFMMEHELFDLLSKPGKSVGGYSTGFPDFKAPFIFSNFNGTSDDVDVLTHEAGHAFAYYVNRGAEPMECIWPTLEGCEVHSMSMEFIAWKWLGLFYGDKADLARRAHLESAVTFLPYGCMVDEFQHIVYDNPELTPAERHKEWLGLERRYRPHTDFDGLPFYGEGRGWQRQTHIYKNPFYYIDYCLAQSVALEVWGETQEDFSRAWEKYMAYTRQGGRYTFTELLKNAGLNDPFTPGALDFAAGKAAAFLG